MLHFQCVGTMFLTRARTVTPMCNSLDLLQTCVGKFPVQWTRAGKFPAHAYNKGKTVVRFVLLGHASYNLAFYFHFLFLLEPVAH